MAVDMIESRLGVGRKLNQHLLSLRAGGVNALLTISLLAWCRLLVAIFCIRVIVFAGAGKVELLSIFLKEGGDPFGREGWCRLLLAVVVVVSFLMIISVILLRKKGMCVGFDGSR